MKDNVLQTEVLDCVLQRFDRMGAQTNDMQDYASTLLAAAVCGNRYICLHLGDGVIGVQRTDRTNARRLLVLSPPENGEFINETIFTTSAGARDHLRVYRGRLDTREECTTGMILMSDGPEAALYQAGAQSLAPACGKLLSSCRRLPPRIMRGRLDATVKMLADRITQDDCSIALLAR